jgi:hypothetical protein
MAYDKISKRTGQTIDGQFIKDKPWNYFSLPSFKSC